MGLNIKNAETHRLAVQLAQLTGEDAHPDRHHRPPRAVGTREKTAPPDRGRGGVAADRAALCLPACAGRPESGGHSGV
jgi:hypothetical protein